MAQKAASETNKSMEKEQGDLGNTANQIQNYVNGGSSGETGDGSDEGNDGGDEEIEEPPVPEEPATEFSRAYGNVDVVFVNKANKLIDANAVPTPTLGEGMVPVKWNETDSSWYVCQSTDNSWYSYTQQDKKWANIMIRDGLGVEGITDSSIATIEEMAGKKVTKMSDMFVYVPRYSYKISYKNASGTVIGYSDSDGITNVKGNVVTGTRKQGAIEVKGNVDGKQIEKYVLHPAFQKFETDELIMKNGGWNENLAGIWIAKFEASRKDATGNSAGSASKVKVQPGIISWRGIKVHDVFINCESYKKELQSHLIKNSEWGATAYLAVSKYGKNGEIAINDASFRTGGGIGTVYIDNTAQSTTGNITGIYDMSGGVGEYTASYLNHGKSNLQTYGASLVGSKNVNMKQLYSSGSDDTEELNYKANAGIYGDAIYETSTAGKDINAWYGGDSYNVYGTEPFFMRGGDYAISNSGVFWFESYTGNTHGYIGFRPALVVP